MSDITGHGYVEGAGIGCAYQYDQGGEWRERCGLGREHHSTPAAPDHAFDPDPDRPSSPFCMKCPQMQGAHPGESVIIDQIRYEERVAAEQTEARRQARIVQEERDARVAASIPGPHSRACGMNKHDHGTACHENCPTCHGLPVVIPAVVQSVPRSRVTVLVYTSREQQEQPKVIHYVTAISVVGTLLTIKCDVTENDYTFSAHHRFEASKWIHFEVHND